MRRMCIILDRLKGLIRVSDGYGVYVSVTEIEGVVFWASVYRAGCCDGALLTIGRLASVRMPSLC